MLSSEMETTLLERINQIPIVPALQLKIICFEEGYCESKVPRKTEYDGIFESFHGGLLMTVADSTACFAILTRAGANARLTTTDMNIRFLAPCFTDVTAKARVIKFGRTLCPVAVDLYDEKGVLVAIAQVTYMLLPS